MINSAMHLIKVESSRYGIKGDMCVTSILCSILPLPLFDDIDEPVQLFIR